MERGHWQGGGKPLKGRRGGRAHQHSPEGLENQKVDGRFKARVVVQGYSQKARIDCSKKFAPVHRIGNQRNLLAIARKHDYPAYQVDVQITFLQSPIADEIYVKSPPGQQETDLKTRTPIVMKPSAVNMGWLISRPMVWENRHSLATHRFYTNGIGPMRMHARHDNV